MYEDQDQTICIAWFRREQWFLIKQKADDPEIIEDTYEEWEKEAESLVQKLIAIGKQFNKIDVDIFELEEWYKANGLPNVGNARSRFAAEKGQDLNNRGFDL